MTPVDYTLRKMIKAVTNWYAIPYNYHMQFSSVFFDLDDTLYPSTNGLWEAIREKMNQYMEEILKLPVDEIPALRRHYFITYGTTLRGLQHHHNVDADEFLAYVHDIPLSSYLQPDPHLRSVVQSMPQKKWIFTNADSAHALRVITELGLGGCFDGIIDVRSNGFYCKPQAEAYRSALAYAGETDTRRCVYLDDSPHNLAPATEMGFLTVLVGTDQPDPAACLSICSIHELPHYLPQLWNNKA
jgi:putative hydrolase of the HAD superfamily